MRTAGCKSAFAAISRHWGRYISTGSLYLRTAGLLPLVLPQENEFWNTPAANWTQKKIWAGENLSADHAIKDVRTVEVPNLTQG